MKWMEKVFAVMAILALVIATTFQVGCADTSPKNVDNDPKTDELEMPDISDDDSDDEDSDDDSDDSNKDGDKDKKTSPAELNGPKNG